MVVVAGLAAVVAVGCERKPRVTPPALVTPAATPEALATPAPTPAPTAGGAAGAGVTRAIIEQLASKPRDLLDMIDAHSGVLVAISTGCENDEGVDLVRHLCGAAARRTLQKTLPALVQQIKHARMFEDEDGPGGFACKDDVCHIPATSECEPSFTLSFSPAGKLVRFVERDDWQAQEELQQAFTARIDALPPAACP